MAHKNDSKYTFDHKLPTPSLKHSLSPPDLPFLHFTQSTALPCVFVCLRISESRSPEHCAAACRTARHVLNRLDALPLPDSKRSNSKLARANFKIVYRWNLILANTCRPHTRTKLQIESLWHMIANALPAAAMVHVPMLPSQILLTSEKHFNRFCKWPCRVRKFEHPPFQIFTGVPVTYKFSSFHWSPHNLQVFSHQILSTEVNGNPARRNLGVFLADLCIYKGLPNMKIFIFILNKYKRFHIYFLIWGECHESGPRGVSWPSISPRATIRMTLVQLPCSGARRG